ncbi:MAG: ABC transporter permease [Chloroflexia bacterium]
MQNPIPPKVRTIRAQDRSPGLLQALIELYYHRELLVAWSIREIKVRYKQTLLGVLWAILQPLVLMALFSIIFTHFISVPTDGIAYPIFSYTALLPWTFFANAVTFGTPSLVSNMNLVTKIYFPREIIPLAAIAASLLDLLVAAAVLIGMMLCYGVPLHGTALLVPIVLLAQILLTIGVVLFAAALNVFYRDVRFVIPLLVQAWMYVTPVIYPISAVPARFRSLYMLNPMAGLIESYRALLLHGELPPWNYWGSAAVISLAVFWFAYRWFKRVEQGFADLI